MSLKASMVSDSDLISTIMDKDPCPTPETSQKCSEERAHIFQAQQKMVPREAEFQMRNSHMSHGMQFLLKSSEPAHIGDAGHVLLKKKYNRNLVSQCGWRGPDPFRFTS